MSVDANTEALHARGCDHRQVVRKESGVGIPDPIVQIFDVDRSAPLCNPFARTSNDPQHAQSAGSVLTDQKHEFVPLRAARQTAFYAVRQRVAPAAGEAVGVDALPGWPS